MASCEAMHSVRWVSPAETTWGEILKWYPNNLLNCFNTSQQHSVEIHQMREVLQVLHEWLRGPRHSAAAPRPSICRPPLRPPPPPGSCPLRILLLLTIIVIIVVIIIVIIIIIIIIIILPPPSSCRTPVSPHQPTRKPPAPRAPPLGSHGLQGGAGPLVLVRY